MHAKVTVCFSRCFRKLKQHTDWFKFWIQVQFDHIQGWVPMICPNSQGQRFCMWYIYKFWVWLNFLGINYYMYFRHKNWLNLQSMYTCFLWIYYLIKYINLYLVSLRGDKSSPCYVEMIKLPVENICSVLNVSIWIDAKYGR